MMKPLLISFILLGGMAAYAQNNQPVNYVRATNTSDALSDGGLNTFEQLWGIPLPPGGVKGDTYESAAFEKCKIQLYKADKEYDVQGARLDISSNQLEVRRSNAEEVFAVPGKNIKSFTFHNPDFGTQRVFVNGKSYLTDGVPFEGFLEVLADGQNAFFKSVKYYVKQPDYKPEVAMGSRDAKIVKTISYYTVSNNELVKVNIKNKKKLAALFKDQDKALEYIETNKVLGDEARVASLFLYMYGNK